MTTVEQARNTTAPIVAKLRGLRARLRQWVAVRGLGKFLWWVLAILACDLVLDRVFKMDLSQRTLVLILMAIAGVYLLFRFLMRPLSRSISDERLLLQVEQRNPTLKENVIAAFDLARQTDLESRGMSTTLAEKTIRSGVEKAQAIDFGTVLDRQQRNRNLRSLAGAALLTLGLGIAVAQVDLFQIWFRRNLMLTSDLWPQSTYLQIANVVDGKIVVPRGADYRQVVEVIDNPNTEESGLFQLERLLARWLRRGSDAVSDVEVTLEMDGGSGRSLQRMNATGRNGGREHSFTFHSIASEYRIRARGGDAVTEWVDLILVEPPAILDMKLTTALPEYTHTDPVTMNGSGPHRVLNGSQVTIDVVTNKPLKDCLLVQGDQAIALQPIDEGRQAFQATLGRENPLSGGKYQFQLVDDANLTNIREFNLDIRMTEDRAPIVRGQLRGISGLIVPRARLPVLYSLEDDYGLTRLSFDCNWTTDDGGANQALTFPMTNWPERPPQVSSSDLAVLDVERLNLQPATSLRFVLVAEDNQIPDPGRGESREFLLRIVTDEELRADLLRREIEQRKSFQQAYDAQMSLASEMRELISVPAGGMDPEQWQNERQNRLINLYRSQRGIGTSVDMVANRFEEFLIEVENNRLDEETAKIDPDRTLTARFANEIVGPIRFMDENMITAATRGIDSCRRLIADRAEFALSVEETIATQEAILERMREIMASMESSESFQEAVNRLVEIKRIEEGLLKQIESSGDTKGLFDDDK